LRNITFKQAINEVLAEEMKKDPKIFIMGEDIATGGAYAAVCEGLPQKVGEERVINTPISESCFCGAALGAALRGYRPIVEFMIGDFFFVAADQIINQIAKARYMSGGKVSVPIVLRFPTGGYKSMAAQHSQNLEYIFTHTPGIKTVYPSGAYSAKGLLKAAIKDDNPVVFMEAKILYEMQETVPDDDYVIPIGKANVVGQGKDLTIAAYGYQVYQARKAMEEFADCSIELIDMLSLNPLDMDTILTSVSKTRRLLLVQEDFEAGSISEHIGYHVYGHVRMQSRIEIVSSRFSPMPFSPPLENTVLPQVEDIKNAIQKILSQ
jgi:acetoin:2,6-dichlorophenolindophenol oxidoreductase subunit beta